MSAQMSEIKCPYDDCKFRNGCIVCKSVDSGARFSPVLRLKLESLCWKVKCFSYVQMKGGNHGRVFPV